MGRLIGEKMTTEVEKARQTQADLEQKLAAAEGRVVEMSTERRRLAFDANTGDADAKRALDKLNKESAVAGLEIENVRSALDEAKRRRAEAERTELMAHDRENAARWLEIAERRVERGKRIHAALDSVRKDIEADKADVDELHVLGCQAPTSQQFLVYGGLALSTFLTMLPLKAERHHLAPRERRSFQQLAIEQSAAVARLAAPFLDKAEAA
jgi:hypothetical protein